MPSPKEQEHSSKRKEIRETIHKTQSLPTVPSIVRELDQILQEQNPKIATIAQVIAKDVATTSKVLEAVNMSPHYAAGGKGETWDIRQAVAQLGVEEVRRLVSTLSLVTVFPDALTHVDYFDFWRHSIGVAGAARLLAVHTFSDLHVDPEEAYTTGLMHDMGWLLLDQFMPELATSIMRRSLEEGIPRIEAERDVMGTDHGEVGGMLLERWRQPAEIIEGVSWHHEPRSAETRGRSLAAIVHVSDRVCRAARVGDSGEGQTHRPSRKELQALGISCEDANKMFDDLVEVAQKMADIIVHAGPE